MSTSLPSDGTCSEQLLSLMKTRSETFLVSKGHRRTLSDYGSKAAPAASPAATTTAVESRSCHRPLSKRLSLEPRPTASMLQRRRISNELSPQMLAGDAGNPLALERARRGARKTGNDDGRSSGSSSDENVLPERERRPQSAWNSRSGRRPQFTFSDLDATGADNDELSDERTMTIVGGSVQRTTPKRMTGARASQIPVRTDRLHPATNNHASACRRHSVNAIASQNTTVLDLTRDREAEVESTSGCQKSASLSPPQTFRGRSFTEDQHEARMRVLARLAGSDQQPEAEVTSSVVSRRPHKLNPIFSTNVVASKGDLLCLDDQSMSNMAMMTSHEVDISDVTSGVGGDANGQDGSCRLRPAVSRKAKAIMMM